MPEIRRLNFWLTTILINYSCLSCITGKFLHIRFYSVCFSKDLFRPSTSSLVNFAIASIVRGRPLIIWMVQIEKKIVRSPSKKFWSQGCQIRRSTGKSRKKFDRRKSRKKIHKILKADGPHSRYYPHTPTDYRHTDKHLRLVMPEGRTDGWTDRRTDIRMDRRTLPSYIISQLRGR